MYFNLNGKLDCKALSSLKVFIYKRTPRGAPDDADATDDRGLEKIPDRQMQTSKT
jgi:hypothetical protein